MSVMARLTLEQIARETGNADDTVGVTSLQLSHRALSDVSCLTKFQNLEKLDLSYNCLSSLEDLSPCGNLKWLSVVENKLKSLKGVENLSKLMILNAGKNNLQKMDEVQSVPSLRALILNDNNISSICKLDQLKYLNTLVLSRNPIYDIGLALAKAKSITKLSLSHCQIQNIGSSLTSCTDLKEVRFAHNKITTLPADLARNVKLENLDLGNNLIEHWSDLKVISAFHKLKNLNLQGNPVVEKEKLVKKVKKLIPNLRIFNSKPIEKSEGFVGAYKSSEVKDDSPALDTTESQAAKIHKNKIAKLKTNVLDETKLISSSKVDDAARGSTDDGGEKESKKSKSKSKREKNNVADKSSQEKSRTAKELKRKNSMDKEVQVQGIDDVETPFADIIFSDKSVQQMNVNEDDTPAAMNRTFSGAIVIDHTKKKKKAKLTETGPSALQFLSKAEEIGLGGTSAWE